MFLDKTPEQLAQPVASLEAVCTAPRRRECLPAACAAPSTGLFDNFAELQEFHRENGAAVSTGATAADLRTLIALLEDRIAGHWPRQNADVLHSLRPAAITGKAALCRHEQ